MAYSSENQRTNRISLPWWVYLALAFIAYVGFKYLLPNLMLPREGTSAFSSLCELLAPISAALLLLVAATALYKNAPSAQEKDKECATDVQDSQTDHQDS